ncbi:MAG: hypothetical protein IPH86_17100 [bacterium]|nr:hypothetical protein [bacterium]
MTLDQTFAIFASTYRSQISHSKYASLKVKDCVADMFRKRYDPRQTEYRRAGSRPVDRRARGGRSPTIFIDCSGRLAAPP